ncbi:MAG: hypothetical protein AB7L13_05765 [Acidimicrobiia bacterium]
MLVAMIGAAATLLAAVIAVVWPRGDDKADGYPVVPTTSAAAVTVATSGAASASSGTTTTTSVSGTTRSAPAVVGSSRFDAEAKMKVSGFEVTSQPARVDNATKLSVVGQRQSGNAITLIVADPDFCRTTSVSYKYCDGRPIAQMRMETCPARVGDRVRLVDQSAGVVREQTWRWSQGGKSGILATNAKTFDVTVGGLSKQALDITNEVRNEFGTDSLTYRCEVP